MSLAGLVAFLSSSFFKFGFGVPFFGLCWVPCGGRFGTRVGGVGSSPKMVSISVFMKAQGMLFPAKQHLSPEGQYTLSPAPWSRMLFLLQGKQNLWFFVDGHWTKCVSSRRCWHRLQHKGVIRGPTPSVRLRLLVSPFRKSCGGECVLVGDVLFAGSGFPEKNIFFIFFCFLSCLVGRLPTDMTWRKYVYVLPDCYFDV